MVNNTGILPPFGRNMLQMLQGIVNMVFTDFYMGKPSEDGLSDRSKKGPVAADGIGLCRPASGPAGSVPTVPLSSSEV
jgi:hypothetical protein